MILLLALFVPGPMASSYWFQLLSKSPASWGEWELLGHGGANTTSNRSKFEIKRGKCSNEKGTGQDSERLKVIIIMKK